MNRSRCLALCLVCLLWLNVDTRMTEAVIIRQAGDDTYTPADERMAMYQKHVELAKKSEYKNHNWYFLGPTNISGRVTDLAATTPRSNTYTIYAATASGGVWKTDNEGTT